MLLKFSIILSGGVEVYSYQSKKLYSNGIDPQIISGLIIALRSVSETLNNPFQKIQFSNMTLYIRSYGEFVLQFLFEENIELQLINKIFDRLAKEILIICDESKDIQSISTEKFDAILSPFLIKLQEPSEINIQAISHPQRELTSKIAMLGLAGAGKTTLKEMFFKNWTKEMTKSIKPTVGLNYSTEFVKFIEGKITILDFGGQKIYRKTYLNNNVLWKNLAAILFIVDVQNYKSIESSKRYLNEIWENISKNNINLPKLAIIFHKYDPDKRDILQNNLNHALACFNHFSKEATFHLSTIKDSTYQLVIIRTLYLALPSILIKKLLEDNFLDILEKEILSDFKTISSHVHFNKIFSEIKEKIRKNMRQKGIEIGKIFQNEWLKCISGEWLPKSRLMSSKNIEIISRNNSLIISTPLYQVSNIPSQLILLIMEELLNGIQMTFNLPRVRIIEESEDMVKWELPISDQISIEDVV